MSGLRRGGRTNPFNLRPRLRPLASPEALEPRQLLSSGVDASFARVAARAIPAGSFEFIPLNIGPNVLATQGGRRALVRVALDPADSGGFGPNATPQHVFLALPGGPRPFEIPAGPAGRALVSLQPGSYLLRVFNPSGAPRNAQVNLSLAGDADGDFAVTRADLRAIRAHIGQTAGPGDLADVNGDGQISGRDLALARRNLGASTPVRPLAVTAGLLLDSLDRPDAVITGQTTPGATVRVDRGADGSFEKSTTADTRGTYYLSLPIPVGTTPVVVEARDAFGQVADATLSLTRHAVNTADTTPPVLGLGPIDTGLHLYRVPPTYGGSAYDNGSGLASVTAWVDGGPRVALTLDALGRYTFTPTVGPTDGAHTVRFQATDRAGNVSPVTATDFTIDTKAPTVSLNVADKLVPAGADLVLHYSEPVIHGDGGGPVELFPTFESGPPGPLVDLTAVWAFDNRTLSLRPLLPLPSGTYTLIVAAALTDYAGNSTAGVPKTFHFTVDAVAPVATLNVTGTLTVPTSTLDVSYSEPVTAAAFGAGAYSLVVTSGAQQGQGVPVQFVTQLNATTVRLNLAGPLPNGSYRLAIGPTVTDPVGNGVTPSAFPFAVSLPTDTQAPTASLNATGTLTVPTSTLLVTFSEPVSLNANDAAKYHLKVVGGPNDGKVVALDSVSRLSDTVVQVTLAAPLSSASYRLTLDPTIADLSGNPLATPLSFDFAVALQVNNEPPVASVALGATVTVPTSSFLVTFSKPMSDTANTSDNYAVTVRGGPNDGQAVPINYVSRQDDTHVLVAFGSPLLDGNYRLTILPAVQDLFGNALVAPRTFDFAVSLPADSTPPTATTNLPASVSAPVFTFDVTYNEAVSAAANAEANYVLTVRGGPGDGQVVPLGYLSRLDDTTVRVTLPAPLGSGGYRLTLSPAITDLKGNALAAPRVFDFTENLPPDSTAPTAALSISGTVSSPFTEFNVLYSEPVTAVANDETKYALTTAGGTPITLAYVSRVDERTVFVTFNNPLTPGDYRFTIDQAVTDVSGNALANPRTFLFTVS